MLRKFVHITFIFRFSDYYQVLVQIRGRIFIILFGGQNRGAGLFYDHCTASYLSLMGYLPREALVRYNSTFVSPLNLELRGGASSAQETEY